MYNCLSDLTASATQTIKQSDNQAINKFFSLLCHFSFRKWL